MSHLMFQLSLILHKMVEKSRHKAVVTSLCSAPIILILFAIGPFSHVRAQEVWQLNTSYTITQSSFKEQYGPWALEQYPGSLAFLVMGGAVADVSTYLCLISSPSPSSNSSIIDLSFTLSIYMISPTYAIYPGAIIWTANRDHPVSEASSITVHLLPDGNLVLLGDDLNTPIWSSNTAHMGVTTMALTRDPVTLVLRNSSGYVFWQSADYPTDTLTNYQFLGPGRNLTSWASPTDPSSGAYTLVMEVSGLALYAGLHNPQPYWIWSYYGFNDTLSIKHTCESSSLAAFMNPEGALEININNPFQGFPLDNDSHWPPFCAIQPNHTFDRLPFKQYGVQASNSTFLRLEYDGNLRVYSLGSAWATQLDIFQSDTCGLPTPCGPYGVCTSGSQCICPAANDSYFNPINTSALSFGCERTSMLTCNVSSRTDQTMLQLGGVDYVANDYTPALNITTERACVDVCSQNCSCMAAFWRHDTNVCHHVDEVQSLRGSLNQKDHLAYLKVNIIPEDEKKKSETIAIVASVVSMVFVSLVIGLVILYCRYKKLAAEDDDDDDEDGLLGAIEGFPTRFTYKELHQITNGFEKQLGKGGFGAVYLGQLLDGTEVAVKKLESANQGNKEFKAEVAIMGGISHNNLLRLRGFCAQKGHRLLVYEYMENGSLDQWLFAEQHKKSQLTWDVRYKITLGIARGLAYLHHDSREKVIHLDIKPQNILLDESFDAKVADFGLSRLISKSETHVMTAMRGTPGYLAPDWVKEGVIDEKCDVYSFGMLLMEIISGRKNLDYSIKALDQVYYPEWAFWQAQQEDITKLTDATVDDEMGMLQLKGMINTAFLCVLEDPALRPSMDKVVQMLLGHIPVHELHLSTLHQGLLFVLKSPSSFAKTRIDEALQELMRSFSDATPLLDNNERSGITSSFNISAR